MLLTAWWTSGSREQRAASSVLQCVLHVQMCRCKASKQGRCRLWNLHGHCKVRRPLCNTQRCAHLRLSTKELGAAALTDDWTLPGKHSCKPLHLSKNDDASHLGRTDSPEHFHRLGFLDSLQMSLTRIQLGFP